MKDGTLRYPECPGSHGLPPLSPAYPPPQLAKLCTTPAFLIPPTTILHHVGYCALFELFQVILEGFFSPLKASDWTKPLIHFAKSFM